MANRLVSSIAGQLAAAVGPLLVAISLPGLAYADAGPGQSPTGVASFLDGGSNTDDVNQVGYYPRCRCCPEEGVAGPAPQSSQGGMGDQNGNGPAPNANDYANLGQEQFGATGAGTMTINDAPGGYLDNPIVATWFRARYDVAVNDPHPDLAEYLYAKYGNAGGPGPSSPTGNSPTSANYQVGSFYGELQLAPRLSVFAQLQIMRTDIFYPDGGGSSVIMQNGGIGDTQAGFKYALIADQCRYLTFQFRTYAPTGDASRGLGTNHVSLEPGLLYLRKLSDRAYLQGEFLAWIPVGGTDYAGNVLQYGAGVGYDVLRTYGGSSPLNPYVAPGLRVTAVTEFVGWTVLNGKFTPAGQSIGNIAPQSADGYSVLNVKPGFRFTRGLGSVYAGAGIAITGDRWYSDLFRVEYRRMF